jgi:LasA protease
VIVLVVLLALLATPLPTLTTTPAPTTGSLVDAVTAALPAREESTGAQVTVLREDPSGWAFGSAVQLAPAEPHAYPYGWLWLAHRDGGWQVAVEGSAGFAALSRRSPLLGEPELAVLGGMPESTASDYRTGMRLPYARGQSWYYTGGPHEMGGGPRSSIDLAGGDGKVRAARAGLAYRMCRGWVRVVHDRGFSTDYYHLHDAIKADGLRVTEGQFLGRIGVDVSCGGSATGPHVHFSLRRGGAYVDIERYGIGKWTIQAGAEPYEGSARHGSRRVTVGGRLYNYGALGRTEGVVDTNGGGVLYRRAGPGTGHEVLGTVRDGATVRVVCSARGTTHTGRNGYISNLWNRLAGGGWVSDVFLWTGTGAPVAGWC